MINDRFLGDYIGKLKAQIRELQCDIAETPFTDMYSVGRLQGRVLGLKESQAILEQLLEEQDR